MNYEHSFKDLFESITDYRKLVLIIFLFENNSDLLNGCGFLKSISIVYVKILKI